MSHAQPDFVANFQCIARTDVGMRRANNQDSYAVVFAEDEQSWQQRGHLLIVADGMGAHAAGELASKLAVDTVPHLYYHDRERPAAEALRTAISDANGEIHRRGNANQDFRGMGTTASVLVLRPAAALVGHVGDSRVYRLRRGRLEQLTFDHSLQWELRRNTKINEDSDFARSIPKNVITRSLGPNNHVTVDVEGPFPLEKGDIFLICSDGLTGQIPDAELAELLSYLPLDEAAQLLIDLANLRGGPDNITLILVRVVDEPVPMESSTPQPKRRPNQSGGLPLAGTVAAPIAGVCLLFAIFLLIAEQMIAGVVFGLAGIGVLIAAAAVWLRSWTAAPDAETQETNGGDGPYATYACRENGDLVGILSQTLTELRQAARDENWSVRWQDIDALRERAGRSADAGRFPEAVRHYAHAIRQMMEQLRRQPPSHRTNTSADP